MYIQQCWCLVGINYFCKGGGYSTGSTRLFTAVYFRHILWLSVDYCQMWVSTSDDTTAAIGGLFTDRTRSQSVCKGGGYNTGSTRLFTAVYFRHILWLPIDYCQMWVAAQVTTRQRPLVVCSQTEHEVRIFKNLFPTRHTGKTERCVPVHESTSTSNSRH